MRKATASTVVGWLSAVVLGLLLAGCDRCGDWASPFKVEACRDMAPPR